MIERSDRLSLRWQAWVIPMAAGFAVATLTVALVVPPAAHSLTWSGVFSRSALLLLLAAFSVLAAIWAICWTFREQLGMPTASLRASAWSAAIWLPLLLLLWSEHAVWVMVAPLPIAAILTHFSRRQYLAAQAADADDQPVFWFSNDLFATATARKPLPIGVPALALTLLLQAACLAFAFGFPALSESLLIVLMAATVWFFTSVPQSGIPARGLHMGKQSRRAAVLPCFLLTCLALTPFLQQGLGSGRLNAVVMAGVTSVQPPKIRATHVYSSIVLLAPPMEKHKMLTPTPASLTTGSSFKPTRALTIPFDGAYEYLEVHPWRTEHEVLTQRGDPIHANVHSTTYSPLNMTAHQRFGERINAGCCSGIDLALTNGDNRYGRIDVEMILSEVHPGGHTVTRSLGTVPIRSSLQEKISLYRAPVNEVLHFPISGNAKTLQFNDITLRIKLSEHRDMAGAKVRIRDFKLIP